MKSFIEYLESHRLSKSRQKSIYKAIAGIHYAYCYLDKQNLSILNNIGITRLVSEFAERESSRQIEVR